MLNSIGVSSGLVPSSFHHPIFFIYFTSPIRATCPSNPILLDLITRKIFDTTKHEAPRYVIFSRFLHLFCCQLMKTHRYTESIQNSRNGSDWKTSSWTTKSSMNVTVAICLGDEMFGMSVFECALSVLLSSVCVWVCTVCAPCRSAVIIGLWTQRGNLLQMAYLEPAARSVSQPSWIRLAPRHAASCTVTLLVRSAGSPIMLWYGTWTHGLRQTDRQTDVQCCICLLCYFRQISACIGSHLNSNRYRWELLWLYMCSQCVVLCCSLRLSVQFTVCDPPASLSNSLQCQLLCCRLSLWRHTRHTRQTQDNARRLSTDSLSLTAWLRSNVCTSLCLNAIPWRRIVYCVLR
jgi:hypothetical protein